MINPIALVSLNKVRKIYNLHILLIYLLLGFLPLSAFADCKSGEIIIRFSHAVNPERHPIGIAARNLAQRINTEMEGKVCMEVFANAILYNDDQVVEAMLNGDIQMAAPNIAKVEKYTKQLQVFSLPFMFKNTDALNEFRNSLIGTLMRESMVGKGIRGLGFWHIGMAQLSAYKPLIKPEDAQGLKFRVAGSHIDLKQMQALNATGKKMALSEVYSALHDGRVQGQEDTWANIFGKKFYQVQDSITDINHKVIGTILISTVKWFNSLPVNIKVKLLTIIREVTEKQNKDSVAQNAAAKQLILFDGGRVQKLTKAERQLWIDALKPIWKEYEKDVPDRIINYIQEINSKYK